MVELPQTAAPQALLDYVKTDPPPVRDDFDTDLSFKPVKDLVKARRNGEQGGCCVYCEQALKPDHGHVEHVYPKSRDGTRTFEYANLAQSCDGYYKKRHVASCGHKKGEAILATEPGPGCNAAFVVHDDGTIEPDRPNLPDEAADALKAQVDDVLGLNHAVLKGARKAIIDGIKSLPGHQRTQMLQDGEFRFILTRLLPYPILPVAGVP